MNTNKRNIAISIICLAILILAGVLVWQRQQTEKKQTTETVNLVEIQNQPESQNTQTSDEIASVKDLIDGEYQFDPVDTSNWQTYRNEELGFEVKIPKDWFCGGVALDPNSETNLACLEQTQKQEYYSGQYKGNDLVMVHYLNNAYDKQFKELPGNSFKERVESADKEGNIYSAKINQESVLISVNKKYNYRYAFDVLGGWSIIGSPKTKKNIFDTILLSFRSVR